MQNDQISNTYDIIDHATKHNFTLKVNIKLGIYTYRYKRETRFAYCGR